MIALLLKTAWIAPCVMFIALFCKPLPAYYDSSQRSFYLHFSGNLLYTGSEADKVVGALYSEKYANPVIAVMGLGFLAKGNFYTGLRYEYWSAGRKYLLNRIEYKDTLTYYTLGLDAGYLFWGDKIFCFILGGLQYPLDLKVTAASNVYLATSKPIALQLRVALGVKFAHVYSMLLEGGYRIQNLGTLTTAQGANYLDGAAFNLSSMFLGVGLYFHF